MERTGTAAWIAQEALNNTVKHAHAAHASIHLRRAHDTLELLIMDDGRGITPEQEPEAHGFGLGSMRERASLSGGRAGYRVKPGHGHHDPCVMGKARQRRRYRLTRQLSMA